MSVMASLLAQPRFEEEDQRLVALSYMADAFEEARLDGLDADAMVQAALFTAFKELVETYGEDATVTFAEGLARRVREGEFTLNRTRQ